MHARRPDFIPEPDIRPDPGALPDAVVPNRDGEAPAPTPADGVADTPLDTSAVGAVDTPSPRRDPRWPVAALLAGLAVNGLWVALLLWLLGRWIGVV